MSFEDNKKYDDDGYRYAKLSMMWHGWASPVGVGLFFVSIGLTAYLFHLAGLY